MRTRMLSAAAIASLALTAAAGAAPGGSPSPNASCLGTLVAFEAHLAPGFIGNELKAFAPQSAGAVGAFARGLAHEHGGSVEACLPAE